MHNQCKHIFFFMFIILLCPGISRGEQITLELNANTNDVEARLDVQFPAYEAMVSTGGGAILSADNYDIGQFHVIVKDELFIPALTLGLGFRGVWGQVEIQDFEFDLGAVGFMFMGEYDIRQIYAKVPLCVYANISASPSPLSFNETENYWDLNLGIRVHIVRQAAAVVGYRYLNTEFEEDTGNKKASFDAIFFGLQIKF